MFIPRALPMALTSKLLTSKICLYFIIEGLRLAYNPPMSTPRFGWHQGPWRRGFSREPCHVGSGAWRFQRKPDFLYPHPLSTRAPRSLIVPQFLHLHNKGIDLDDLNSEILDTLVKRETRWIQPHSRETSGMIWSLYSKWNEQGHVNHPKLGLIYLSGNDAFILEK